MQQMMKTVRASAAALAAALLVSNAARAATPVLDLSAFATSGQTLNTIATDINNAGQIALTESFGTLSGTAPVQQSSVYRVNTATNSATRITLDGGSPTYLSTAGFTTYGTDRFFTFTVGGATVKSSLNATGTITGYAGQFFPGYASRPFTASGGTASTFSVAGVTSASGNAFTGFAVAQNVNDLGTVVGGAATGTDDNRSRPFVAVSGPAGTRVVYNLGTKNANPNAFGGGAATAINTAGRVVGNTALTIGNDDFTGNQAFYEDPNLDGSYTSNTQTTGTMVVIGTLAPRTTSLSGVPFTPGNSAAYGVNEAGVVVGTANTDDGNNTGSGTAHAFSFTTAGGIRDLGVLAGATGESIAYDINNLGVAVGEQAGVDGATHAVQFVNGTVVDLNTLIDPSSGWVLNTALAINDLNQIVGRGTLNGVTTAFALGVAVPEPTSLAAIASVGAVMLRRRRRA